MLCTEGRRAAPPSQQEPEDLSESWENSKEMTSAMSLKSVSSPQRGELPFTRNPSNRALMRWSARLRVSLVWPKVTALRQMGRNGDKLPALSQSLPLPLRISARGGDYRSSLSLCPSPILILLKGKDPLTWVQASGLCPSLSWHWGRTLAAPKPPSGQDGQSGRPSPRWHPILSRGL